MVESINVLLIEDNPGDIRLVQEMLKDGTESLNANLEVVCTLKAALKRLVTDHIDVILLDLNLPDSLGFDTFKQIKRFSLDTPIIVLSILSNKEIIYETMLAGAAEYLIKGEIENESLVRAIRFALWHHQLIN